MDPAVLGQEVPVGQIDASLRRLWASNQVATKAALVNFAIYSEDPSTLEENTRLIAQVTREHACRAILVAANPGEEETSVRAWITAHCQLSRAGDKSVCSEQVSFLLAGRLRDSLRNIVFAHLESDLPLVFFWQGDFTDRWEPHLYRHIDRLVIDSGSWTDAVQGLNDLRSAARDAVSHFVVLDIAWMRLFSFRLALAGAFDEALALRQLSSLRRLRIRHAPRCHLTGRLMAAWILHKCGRRASDLEIAFYEEEGAPLSGVELVSAEGAISLSREAGDAFVHSRIELAGSRPLQHVTPALSDDCGRLVTERLSRGGNNSLYFKLWRLARPLL